jgi:hypothetical protein
MSQLLSLSSFLSGGYYRPGTTSSLPYAPLFIVGKVSQILKLLRRAAPSSITDIPLIGMYGDQPSSWLHFDPRGAVINVTMPA